jgi:hypothetical protein
MEDHMYNIVKRKHRAMLAIASYMLLTTDETTRVGNCFYIAAHYYVLQDWVRFPILLHLQKMESSKSFGKGGGPGRRELQKWGAHKRQ